MNLDYIIPLKDYQVDIDTLLKEYTSIEHLMADRKRPGSPVLIQKALTIVQNSEESNLVQSIPYTYEVITYLRKTYLFNTVTYRSVMPDTCYSWHTDFSQICIHIPLITNQGCRFVYEDKSFHMPADGSVYVVNNEKPHSFMNGGNSPRVHITIENFGSRPNR
jgi:hypothetical protein